MKWGRVLLEGTAQIKKKLQFFQPSSLVLLVGVLGLCSDLISFVIATAFSCRICGFSDVLELW